MEGTQVPDHESFLGWQHYGEMQHLLCLSGLVLIKNGILFSHKEE
jgi:hypothetical protein